MEAALRCCIILSIRWVESVVCTQWGGVGRIINGAWMGMVWETGRKIFSYTCQRKQRGGKVCRNFLWMEKTSLVKHASCGIPGGEGRLFLCRGGLHSRKISKKKWGNL